MDKDPEKLIEKFVENVLERQGKIVEKVKALYLLPGGEEEEEEYGGQWKREEMVHIPKKSPKSLENLDRASSCFWF